MGLIARDTERCVEGAIARLNSEVRAHHHERIRDRVEDRLGEFAFVDGLIGACAERSHIRERQHGAADRAITYRAGGYPNDEPSVPVAKIGPPFHTVGDDLAALLFQAGQAGEHRDIAAGPAHVRSRETKPIRRRLIEARDYKVTSHENDGHFNGIKDVDQIDRCRDALETGRHRPAREALYSLRHRCSTGSATAGRT